MNTERKSISPQHATLLQNLQHQNLPYITLESAKAVYPELSDNAVEKIMSRMAQKGLLMRLKKGLYHVIPYEQTAHSFMPNWHLLANILVQNQKHYIAYHAAMQIHGLSTQPALREYIVVDNPIRPSTLHVKEIPFQFVYHNTAHFFGYSPVWINAFNQVPCSDLEKTFIDALFRPNYAGGIVEIARALHLAKERLDMVKLLTYSQQFGSQAVIKRLGFLLELLEINAHTAKLLQQTTTPSFVVLDPEVPAIGKRNSYWRIQQNITPETIQSALYT
ncbi:MAG: transcriptional regulator [Bacteroidota bacterium]